MASSKPESRVVNKVSNYMEDRGWQLHNMHGNTFQKGIPDAYCLHLEYGYRWVDFKVQGNYSFTKAQKEVWPDWYYNFNVGVYILTGVEDYNKLFGPPNFLDYWKDSYGNPEDYAQKFDPAHIAQTLNGEWLPVEGFPYLVSDGGRVYSEKSKRILKTSKQTSGHLRVKLCRRGEQRRCFVHTLVLECFKGPKPQTNSVCRHLDGNPENNVVTNLVWGTDQENAIDKVKHNGGNSKLSQVQVMEICRNKDGEEIGTLADRYEVSKDIISDILKGKTWSWLTGVTREPFTRLKLTDKQVLEIYNASGSRREIAKRFSVSKSTVDGIKNKHYHKDLLKELNEDT